MIDILTTIPADLPDIETLLDERFGPARHNRTAYRLRDGVAPLAPLCLVARENGELLGSVQCWPLQLRDVDGRRFPLVLLGPVAVTLDHEGEGLGTRLMHEVLARADVAPGLPMLLIGDEPYYGRFGFSAAPTAGWHVPGPVDRARLLLRGSAEGLPAIGWLEPACEGRAAA